MRTAGYACRFRATGTVVGALHGVGNPPTPSAMSGTGGSGALGRLEQPPMLEDGVAVGHSGDVVSHRASATGGSMLGLRLHRLIAMLSRHETHVLEKRLEKLLDHPPPLRGHAQHLVVPVDLRAQERLELEVLLAA